MAHALIVKAIGNIIILSVLWLVKPKKSIKKECYGYVTIIPIKIKKTHMIRKDLFRQIFIRYLKESHLIKRYEIAVESKKDCYGLISRIEGEKIYSIDEYLNKVREDYQMTRVFDRTIAWDFTKEGRIFWNSQDILFRNFTYHFFTKHAHSALNDIGMNKGVVVPHTTMLTV